VSQIF